MVVLTLLVGGFPDMFVSLILFGFLGLLWVGLPLFYVACGLVVGVIL